MKWFVQINSGFGKLKWLLMWKLKCLFSFYIMLRVFCGYCFICPIYGTQHGERFSLGIIDELSIACYLSWPNVAVKINHLYCLTCQLAEFVISVLRFHFQLWGWIAFKQHHHLHLCFCQKVEIRIKYDRI